MEYKIIGYKYNNLEDTMTAINNCNLYYGIPHNQSSITQNWVWYETTLLDNPVFYYINYLDSLQPVLGNPSEFFITIPN
jgi:hypothetical protein